MVYQVSIFPDERLGILMYLEGKLSRKTHCPQQANRVGGKGRLACRPDKAVIEVLLPAERVDERRRLRMTDQLFQLDGHGIDGEVPPRQVWLDAALNRGEIERPFSIRGDGHHSCYPVLFV